MSALVPLTTGVVPTIESSHPELASPPAAPLAAGDCAETLPAIVSTSAPATNPADFQLRRIRSDPPRLRPLDSGRFPRRLPEPDRTGSLTCGQSPVRGDHFVCTRGRLPRE